MSQSDGNVESAVSGSVEWSDYVVRDELSDRGEERVFGDGIGCRLGVGGVSVRGVEDVFVCVGGDCGDGVDDGLFVC